MGCLIELLLEILVEGVLELVFFLYWKLASIFIPDREISAKTKKRIENVVKIICAFLIVILIVGIVILLGTSEELPEASTLNIVGKCMTFIPLTIICIQIVLGVGLMIVKAIRKRR